jgi:hypothetical protein
MHVVVPVLLSEDSHHPWTLPGYTRDRCRVAGSRGHPGIRTVVGSLIDDFRKRITILGILEEHVLILVEDDTDGGVGAGAELVALTEATHG